VSDPPTVVIYFPRPVSANKMFMRQMTRKGHRDLTPEYKEWRDRAGWEVKMQLVGFEPITCLFNVTIEVPRSRMDLDNHLKPILDLCQMVGVISNDRNAVGINIVPADREDCMAAFYALPDAVVPTRKRIRSRIVVGRTWGRAKGTGLHWKLPT
jgi:Holliday junction resolvase RusA-like endonuclease